MLLLATFGALAEPTTQPIVYREEIRTSPPMHVHVVQIDLSDPRISIHAVRAGGIDPDGAGPWQTTLAPTSVAARRENFAVAINANFFSVKEKREILGRQVPYFNGNWAKVEGWAVSSGEVINSQRWHGGVVVGKDGKVEIGLPAMHVEDMRDAVDGSEVIVRDGKATTMPRGEPPSPRTGVGLDAAKRILTFIVVDGRREDYSAGMTLSEFAEEFRKAGCDRAINLDGGGSSTLVMRDVGGRSWSVKNRPSDGHGLWGDPSIERSVAVVLGVRLDEGK